jgi:acyl-CoA reductase-like NAD-dependent aldehyde dehydrogenase
MMAKSNENSSHTQSNRKIRTINPATEETIKEYDVVKQDQINEAVRKARNEFI